MTRRKVQLAWILNPSSRKATFKKRRECLMRKVKEIATLTGEDACGIVLSPEEGEPPVFWPPSINEVLDRFFHLRESDQCKKMTTLDSFMQERISKMEDQLGKERRKAKDEEITFVMHSIYSHGKRIDSLSLGETHELFWYMDDLRKKCELRILNLSQDNNSSSDSFVLHPPPPPPPPLPFQTPRQHQQQTMMLSDMFCINGNGGLINPNSNDRYGMDNDMSNVAASSSNMGDNGTDED